MNISPHNLEIEEAILGSLMIDSKAMDDACTSLEAEFFYKPQHQELYKAIFNLFADSEPIDMLTVSNELKRRGKLESAGGKQYIMRLCSSINSAAHIEYHIKILHELYIKRCIIQVSQSLLKNAFDQTTDALDLLSDADKSITKLTSGVSNHSQDLFLNQHILSGLKKIANTIENGNSGINVGINAIDEITGGFQPADFVIIAGRPGMGKTLVGLKILESAAKQGHVVGCLSLEMSGEQLGIREVVREYYAQEGRDIINATQLRSGKIHPDTLNDLYINQSISNYTTNIIINDLPGQSLTKIKSKAREWVRKHNIKMLLIDYLQLADVDTLGKTLNDQLEKFCQGLKNIAKELNIPIVALSQLNRAVETRAGDKKPQLSDLRSSGGIEQSADTVVFLYRPEYYGITQDMMGNSTKNLLTWIFAKNRFGELGEVNTYCDLSKNIIKDWTALSDEYNRFENEFAFSYSQDAKPPF